MLSQIRFKWKGRTFIIQESKKNELHVCERIGEFDNFLYHKHVVVKHE